MPNGQKDLYAVLGVSKTATTGEIKKVYRRLARKFHPDVNPGDKSAESRFKEISQAADILLDSEKRKLYDRYGEAAFASGFDAKKAADAERFAEGFRGSSGGRAPFDFEAFTSGRGGRFGFEAFEELFGSSRGAQARAVEPHPGETIQVEITIPFAGALKGTTVMVPLRLRTRCHRCGGGGNVNRSVCDLCRGSGETIDSQKVKVRIPEGVDEGSRVRVAGKGASSTTGGGPGDLFVLVHVESHPYFQRKGDDILTEVPITVREAYLGAEIEVPTIQGPVRAKIPAGTVGGQKFRLRGRGARNLQTRAHGDHVYRVNVVVPTAISEAGKTAADRLEVLYGGPVRAHLPKRLEDPESS